LDEPLSLDGLFQFAYGMMDNVTMTREFTDAEIETVCELDGLACYEPNFDMERFDPLIAAREGRMAKFEIVNSQELRCFRCLQPNGDENRPPAP
jgi:hypothetical protein